MATSNFYLYSPSVSKQTLIILHFRYNGCKLVFSTRQKVHPKYWNQKRQRIKETTACQEAGSINQILNKIEVDVNNIYRDLILNDLTPSNNQLKSRLRSKMKLDSHALKSAQNTELDFIEMVDRWIADTLHYCVYKIKVYSKSLTFIFSKLFLSILRIVDSFLSSSKSQSSFLANIT